MSDRTELAEKSLLNSESPFFQSKLEKHFPSTCTCLEPWTQRDKIGLLPLELSAREWLPRLSDFTHSGQHTPNSAFVLSYNMWVRILCTAAWHPLFKSQPCCLPSMHHHPQEVTSKTTATFPLNSPGQSLSYYCSIHTKSPVVARSVVSDSSPPCGLWPARLLCPWDFPGKDTGVGCHSLLQRIFPTQGSNPSHVCLLHWWAVSL